MTRALLVAGWICFALDALVVAAMFFGRDMGDDAAGRGMARGFSYLLAPVLLLAGALLLAGQRTGSKGAILAGTGIVALPFLAFAWNLTTDTATGFLSALRRSREGRFADPRLTAAARAIDRGDVAAAEAALRDPAPDFTARDRSGETLLGYAVRRSVAWNARPEGLRLVRAVLEAGAPVAGAGRDGELLEANAADSADSRTDELLGLLLSHGGDPNAKLPFDEEPLVFSANLTSAKAETLARHGADLGATVRSGSRRGWSAPMLAAERGDWSLALRLVQLGAPAGRVSEESPTLLEVARASERLARSSTDGSPSPEYERLVAFLEEIGGGSGRGGKG
ncbi:MAG: hypothetical protein KJ062_12300 [Thermoanaerobaculia bacterium]|nr:hypothetical protein [Thermoanaerobaculia bacterium]